MTELSLPMEYSITGRSLSATATRRMWMLSASSDCRCVRLIPDSNAPPAVVAGPPGGSAAGQVPRMPGCGRRSLRACRLAGGPRHVPSSP